MAAGSVVMWVGLPLGLIWVASALTDSSQPSMGPYLLILSGLPVGMFAIGKLLGTLDRAHGRITGRLDDGPQRAAWLQSMRDERGPRRKRRSVLDTVMIVSVLAALAGRRDLVHRLRRVAAPVLARAGPSAETSSCADLAVRQEADLGRAVAVQVDDREAGGVSR